MLLVGSGLAASGYLLSRVFVLLSASGAHPVDLCSALFAMSCDGALADERLWILRVPLPGWGLVYFASLAGLLLLARSLRRTFETEAFVSASLLVALGLGAGIALLAWTWLEREPVCPLCVAIHGISLLLLFALQRASPRPLAQQLRLLRSAGAWLIHSGVKTTESARWKLVGFGSVALLAVVAYQWVYVETALRRPPTTAPPDREKVIEAYRASPERPLPVTEGDPHLGPLGAPVRLVVFESFRCPGCRGLARTLSRLRDRFRDRLLVVYKHYPLSTECNARLTRDMQPGACEIAWAAQAAHRQDRFWPFHDALFAAGTDPSREAIAAAARRLKLDPARFAADWKSEATRERVAADIALGDRLQIPGTPTVFVDGRLAPFTGAEALEMVIRYELGLQATRSRQGDHDVMGLGRRGFAGRAP